MCVWQEREACSVVPVAPFTPKWARKYRTAPGLASTEHPPATASPAGAGASRDSLSLSRSLAAPDSSHTSPSCGLQRERQRSARDARGGGEEEAGGVGMPARKALSASLARALLPRPVVVTSDGMMHHSVHMEEVEGSSPAGTPLCLDS